MDIDDGIISNVQLAVIGMWTSLVGNVPGATYSYPIRTPERTLIVS